MVAIQAIFFDHSCSCSLNLKTNWTVLSLEMKERNTVNSNWQSFVHKKIGLFINNLKSDSTLITDRFSPCKHQDRMSRRGCCALSHPDTTATDAVGSCSRTVCTGLLPIPWGTAGSHCTLSPCPGILTSWRDGAVAWCVPVFLQGASRGQGLLDVSNHTGCPAKQKNCMS